MGLAYNVEVKANYQKPHTHRQSSGHILYADDSPTISSESVSMKFLNKTCHYRNEPRRTIKVIPFNGCKKYLQLHTTYTQFVLTLNGNRLPLPFAYPPHTPLIIIIHNSITGAGKRAAFFNAILLLLPPSFLLSHPLPDEYK